MDETPDKGRALGRLEEKQGREIHKGEAQPEDPPATEDDAPPEAGPPT